MCYNKALEIDPNYSHAWTSKGIALAKLAKSKEAENCVYKARDTSYTTSEIIRHFNELPDNLRNLLFKIVNNNQTVAEEVAVSIAGDYITTIPDNIMNLLLAHNSKIASEVARTIA